MRKEKPFSRQDAKACLLSSFDRQDAKKAQEGREGTLLVVFLNFACWNRNIGSRLSEMPTGLRRHL